MAFVRLVKRLYWDLLDREGRAAYLNEFLTHIPGLFGIQIRSYILPKFFKKAGKNIRIFRGARFRAITNLVCGDNVDIGEDSYLEAGGGLYIGNNVIISLNVKIWTMNHNYEKAEMLIREQGFTKKPVIIEDDVWIASDVFIMPGAILKRGCVVSAGSVVGGKEWKPYSIIAGNPARIIGYRR